MSVVLTPRQVQNIANGIKIAGSIDWAHLHHALSHQDWVSVGDDVVEDALTIAQPFLPQAGAAKMVIHLAVSLVQEHKSEGPAAPITPEMILKGVLAAEGVDWRGFYHALKDGNALEAGAMTGEVLTGLAAPFFPPATLANYAFTALAMIGHYTHPAIPYSIPGYHWDVFMGFVKDQS